VDSLWPPNQRLTELPAADNVGRRLILFDPQFEVCERLLATVWFGRPRPKPMMEEYLADLLAILGRSLELYDGVLALVRSGRALPALRERVAFHAACVIAQRIVPQNCPRLGSGSSCCPGCLQPGQLLHPAYIPREVAGRLRQWPQIPASRRTKHPALPGNPRLSWRSPEDPIELCKPEVTGSIPVRSISRNC
jgi:hypothetical protein